VQIVEEEFKHTAAKLGVTGPEASALAHQWVSPEATGLPMTHNDALEDSAHQEQLHRPHHYGNPCLLLPNNNEIEIRSVYCW